GFSSSTSGRRSETSGRSVSRPALEGGWSRAGRNNRRQQMEDSKKPAAAGDAVSLADERATVEVLSSTVLGLWGVVNNLTRLRPSRRPDYRVTIFGSARIAPGNWVYVAVRDLAAELARMGCTVVTGGGPGLMQAANEGMTSAGVTAGRSLGIRVHL